MGRATAPQRSPVPDAAAPVTKGERTRTRILDAAEALFAERGFEAAPLREIARAAGIQQPGLYNHFESKQALYAAVLDRALTPMIEVLERHLEAGAESPELGDLPALMTDRLSQHPHIAALFHDALRGDRDSVGVRMMQQWLDRLFAKGVEAARAAGASRVDRAELAIRIIAIFNVSTGYFLAQRAFESMAKGELTDPANISRQKQLLARIAESTAPTN